MKQNGNGTEHLTPQEKRALLAELLRKKAAAREHAAAQERLGSFDRFSVSSTELEAEAVLDPGIHPGRMHFNPQNEPARIFLTGATGFLGAFLLNDLLENTRAGIYCLVRCTGVEEGKQRILKKLESYQLKGGHEASRIIPVPGDLAQPRLGLPPDQFQRLSEEMDIIYHSAAMVNWINSYEQLKPANVMGIQEILKLACQGKLKPLHYVSTLAVFPLFRNAEISVAREDDSLDHGGLLHGGYTQSKWVAEKLVMTARERGLPVSIYRPGMITGHSQSGAWNTGDFTCQLIKSWIVAGYAPDLDASMDMTPVDYVSSAIFHLSRSEQSLGQVFHLANTQPVDVQELYGWIRSRGYRLELMPYDRWRAAVIALAELSQEKAARALTPLLMAGEAEKASQWVAGVPKFDCSNTLKWLAGTSIRCPVVDEQVVRTYFSYLVGSGFLKASQAVRAAPNLER